MIGLGVGIDYALFITNRYRQGLQDGLAPRDAALKSVGTAGRAVLFAGSTVILALLGMFVLGIQFFNGLAVAAAAAVLMVMMSALFMLPALLSLLGTKTFGLRLPWGKNPTTTPEDPKRWRAYAQLIQKKPLIPFLASLVLVGGLAAPALSLELGFPDDGSQAKGSPLRTGYDLLARGFGPGVGGPFFIAVETPKENDFAALKETIRKLNETDGVASTLPTIDMLPLVELNKETFGDGGKVAAVLVQPTTAPDDPATAQLLDRIRSTTAAEINLKDGTNIYVGGAQAVSTDFTTVLIKVLPVFLLLVVGLGFLALMLLFHSVVIPLTAAITSLLSFGGAMGVTVAIFQWGWLDSLLGVSGTGPILPFLPVMVFAILFGLSMDYQVFLVSRMKESWEKTSDNRLSVREGLAGSGKVVVIAATIMSCVFISFIPTPIDTIKLFGVALAASVIIDAFIVRLVLIPSIMTLLGKANWWLPKWADKILPKISLE
jgi:RND superfamily putative drug exporter